jgi:hypothetical protein
MAITIAITAIGSLIVFRAGAGAKR